MFQLHPQLSKDTYPLRAMPLCRLLLMNDARYPWIILVPEKPDLVEITDLGEEDYLSLMKEVRRATKVMKQLFQVDKMNVAMLGNMVPQLHVHIIGRYKDDPAWPGPVWGVGDAVPYEPGDADAHIRGIRNAFTRM
tara:strand:+ start:340 stop:747 length:408 start_codon:yes stop_codon:yes gene_type:complete